MKCYNCGCDLSENSFCTSCGADVSLYKRLMMASNVFYNQGLEKAKLHDLSGAILCLKQSLNFNKANIQARNLLGLVYFEYGSIPEALAEWVVSKNITPKKNIADDYMNTFQNNATNLADISKIIRRFNLALTYCEQGTLDLAAIQLKKLLLINPRFLPGLQLLALLHINNEENDEAIKKLDECLEIDISNTKALRLKACIVNSAYEISDESSLKRVINRDLDVSKNILHAINEKEFFNMQSLINIIIGLIVGVAITWLLIVPSWKRNEQEAINEQLDEINQEIAGKSSTIIDLERSLSNAEAMIEQYEIESGELLNENEKTVYYNSIIAAINIYLEDKTNLEEIAKYLETIDREFLDKNATEEFKLLYNKIIELVGDEIANKYYDIGYKYYQDNDYEKAIENFEKSFNYNNQDDDVVYNLANAYMKNGSEEEALITYQKVVDLFPDTQNARRASEYLQTSEE